MAKDRMISLEYNFIFDRATNAWSTLSDFENDLADFLKQQGLQGEIIIPIGGNGGRGSMYITKAPDDTLVNMKGSELSNTEAPAVNIEQKKDTRSSEKTVDALVKKISADDKKKKKK